MIMIQRVTLNRSNCRWATGPRASQVDCLLVEQPTANKKRAANRPKMTERFFRLLWRPVDPVEFEADWLPRDPARQKGDSPFFDSPQPYLARLPRFRLASPNGGFTPESPAI